MKDPKIDLEQFVHYVGSALIRKEIIKEKVPQNALLAERAVLLMAQRSIIMGVYINYFF